MGMVCDNCGKGVGDSKIMKGGRTFCCKVCCDAYDHKNPKKAPVCEFC